MTTTDDRFAGPLVIGGGPAGAAAAIGLARGGPTMLIEREYHPYHRACAGILGPVAQRLLPKLGVDMDAAGATTSTHLRVISGDRSVRTNLGIRLRGLTRHQLDAELLRAAAASGVRIARGIEARDMEAAGAILTSRGRILPSAVFVATGRLQNADRTHIVFESVYRLLPHQRAELSGHVELIAFPSGRATLHMVERDAASLTLIVDNGVMAREWRDYRALMDWLLRTEVHLARRLDGAVRLVDRPASRLCSLNPYRFLPGHGEKTWRVGDQAFAPSPILSDGISTALLSAEMAVRSYRTGEGVDRYHRRLDAKTAGLFRASTFVGRKCLLGLEPRALIGGAMFPGLARSFAGAVRLKA